MCTLTFVPTENGYVAGMNRDEKLTRPYAIPPERFDFPGVTAVFPRENSGGTWIGCNSHGNLLALLNWNDVVPPFGGATLRSRGALIPESIGAHDFASTQARLARLDLNQVPPFRLIGGFLGESLIAEWRWDGLRRQEFKFAWAKRHWFSSGVSDALARRERGRACEKAEGYGSRELVCWVRNLHQSHDPVPGPFSICVHREDAATVSYTEVRCSDGGISMSYRSGSPCLTDLFGSETSLEFGEACNRNPVNESCAQTSN
jgi:transport and Golgi organization protein 2